MILYTAQDLSAQSLPPRHIQSPTTAKTAIVENFSAYTLIVSSTRGRYDIVPYAIFAVPVVGGEYLDITGTLESSVPASADIPSQVGMVFSQTASQGYIQIAPIPAYTQPVNVQNASITVGGTVDATITNASITVEPASTATFPISGTVNIAAGQVVNVKNATGSNLTVAGTIDANITNANIDANVINEQIQQSLNYSFQASFTFIPSATQQTHTSGLIQIVPAGQSITTTLIEGWLVSSNSSAYQTINVIPYMVFPDGTELAFTNTLQITANNLSAQPFQLLVPSDFGLPINMFNAAKIVLETKTTGINATDHPRVYIVAHGQTVPDVTSVGAPSYDSPSFLLPGGTQNTTMTNGVPLPVQHYLQNSGTSPYKAVSASNPLPIYAPNSVPVYTPSPINVNGIPAALNNFISASTVAAGATITLSVSPNRIWTLNFTVNNGGEVILKNSNGSWIAMIGGTNIVHEDFTHSGGWPNNGYALEIYNNGTATIYYTLTMEWT